MSARDGHRRRLQDRPPARGRVAGGDPRARRRLPPQAPRRRAAARARLRPAQHEPGRGMG